MDCSICSRTFSSRGHLTCPACARSLLYQCRLNHLTDLLDKESLQKTVQNVLTAPADVNPDDLPRGADLVDATESAKKHQHDLVVRDTELATERFTLVSEQLDLLRAQIDEARKENAARKLAIEQRRVQARAERQSLEKHKTEHSLPLQTNIRYAQRKLDKIRYKTCEGRAKLCQETARLAGLQQRRRKAPDGSLYHDYVIGGVPIFDLRELHVARPEHVSAALENISRLLITCCHYLSIRLPAEIIPPHANYPFPTIFQLHTSYQDLGLPFPGSRPSSAHHSPTASRIVGHGSVPKLRVLHLDRPLHRLQKESPTSYNLFVEGVSLLAWDVAWLCRAQGLPIANSWDDVSAVGRNLWTLLRSHTAVPLSRASIAAKPEGPEAQTRKEALSFPFGDFSHVGTGRFLEGHAGTALMQSWRLVHPTRTIDKVKSHLLTEMSGAEWELIAEEEWDAEREDEKPVMVGGGIRSGTLGGLAAAEDPDDDGKRRSSGWMKLKSRNET